MASTYRIWNLMQIEKRGKKKGNEEEGKDEKEKVSLFLCKFLKGFKEGGETT